MLFSFPFTNSLALDSNSSNRYSNHTISLYFLAILSFDSEMKSFSFHSDFFSHSAYTFFLCIMTIVYACITRALIYYNVYPCFYLLVCFKKHVVQHPSSSVCYVLIQKKLEKRVIYILLVYLKRLLLHSLSKRRKPNGIDMMNKA